MRTIKRFKWNSQAFLIAAISLKTAFRFWFNKINSNNLINSKNAVIFTSVPAVINFSCSYQKVYQNIIANDIIIVSDHAETSTTSDGQFKFTLTQFKDNKFVDLFDSDDEIKLGNNVFFLLTMENPIPNVIYSITGQSRSVKTSVINELQIAMFLMKIIQT